jgi:hypothetical protein
MIPAPPIIQMSFPFCSRRAGCERFDRFVHELHTRLRWRLWQAACEDIVLNSCIEGRPADAFLLEVERQIARLPAPQDRVDRFIERTHTVVALGTRAVKPIGGAVGPGNKAVGTRGDVHDDFSLVDHGEIGTRS